jgi:hypothetical protein
VGMGSAAGADGVHGCVAGGALGALIAEQCGDLVVELKVLVGNPLEP